MTTKTRIIRNIMKEHGKKSIYTNKYPTCRTVKCYSRAPDKALMRDIKTAGKAHGFEVTVKRIKSCTPVCWGGDTYSIIARVDLDNDLVLDDPSW